jgi:hypothetical protein
MGISFGRKFERGAEESGGNSVVSVTAGERFHNRPALLVRWPGDLTNPGSSKSNLNFDELQRDAWPTSTMVRVWLERH